MMSNVLILEQARLAEQQANWSLLTQYLQQLLMGENQKSGLEKSQPAELENFNILLVWALEILEAGDFQERWDVAKIFPSLGNAVIEPLIEILEDEDADLELRWFAGRILGEFNQPAVINALVALLKTSESEELNAMAAGALANLGASAIDALISLLAEEESRLFAVKALAQIRNAQTIAPLLSVVHDRQALVRAAAIEALIAFHDPRIVPVLVEALNDLAAPVRREAVIGLGLRQDLQNELDLVKLLTARLWDFNFEVCQQAVISLGRLKTAPASAALFEVLRSSATPVALQIEVIRALGWMGTSEALEYLQQALAGQTECAVGQEIVAVLGRMELPALTIRAAEILMDLLHSSHPLVQHPSIRKAIALGLGQLGHRQALDSLIYLLADLDVGVRLHALAALKQLAPENARQQLELLASNEQLTPALKAGVVLALNEWPVVE
ncbi:HEAT repeat domain-containing protein [Microcoleus sp. FACHB-68]|uniref:HEAT repeat domain-containing protein n=1 Tax=Microcoleus sp. FACHB-68 TaxID=2692826 RepID=UPI00321FDB31